MTDFGKPKTDLFFDLKFFMSPSNLTWLLLAFPDTLPESDLSTLCFSFLIFCDPASPKTRGSFSDLAFFLANLSCCSSERTLDGFFSLCAKVIHTGMMSMFLENFFSLLGIRLFGVKAPTYLISRRIL